MLILFDDFIIISKLIKFFPLYSPSKLLWFENYYIVLIFTDWTFLNERINSTRIQLTYFSGKPFRLITFNVSRSSKYEILNAREVFTRANESEYDSFSLILSHSLFGLFLGLDRFAAEQGPWRKRKGVYMYSGRSGEDEVKSDFPSIYTCVCRLDNDTKTAVQIQSRNSIYWLIFEILK